MYLNRRIQRIERTCGPDSSGFPPCRTCKNGTAHRIVFRYDGVVDPRSSSPLCPSCGRDVAFYFNIYSAVVGSPPQHAPGPP